MEIGRCRNDRKRDYKMKNFQTKWQAVVQKKNSILCVGLDPAEPGQRADFVWERLLNGTSKLDACLEFVSEVAPYSAAIKLNRNYVKDFSRSEMRRLNDCIHELEMLSIDDCKLADIGETNDAAFFHAAAEGFDAVTFAPFPGNLREATTQAQKRGLGLIALVLMSNPEFEDVKNLKTTTGLYFEHLAQEVAVAGTDGMVIGAPSAKNHLSVEELDRVKELAPDALVLMPGVGAQGGEADEVIRRFGDRVIANVGRTIMYSTNPAQEAKKYRDIFQKLR